VYDRQRHWVQRGTVFGRYDAGDRAGDAFDGRDIDIRALYHDHVFGCFIDDVHGLKSLDVIGEDNVMIETDYPHSDSTWPNSIKLARERLGHLDPSVQLKIMRTNAERLFQFTAPVPH
jgi:hypothetical protein